MTQVALETQQEPARYVAQVNAGKDVVLTRRGKAVARIVPMQKFAEVPVPVLRGEEGAAAFAKMMQLLKVCIPWVEAWRLPRTRPAG